MAPSLRQHNSGTQATSGFATPASVSTQFTTEDVATGNMLMAIVAYSWTGTNNANSIGQVTDDQGNKWRYARETTDIAGPPWSDSANGSVGAAIWICESCTATGTKPTVTATTLNYPSTPSQIVGLQLAVFEYSGFTGYELVEATGVSGQVTSSPIAVTTNQSATSRGPEHRCGVGQHERR